MLLKKGIISIIGLSAIICGLVKAHSVIELDPGPLLEPPEGYSEPEGRVEKLKIDGSVSKYYDENLDLVAFGPGSGWLKIKIRDGISPTLSFKHVGQEDVRQFNKFAENIGLPIRAEFSNNVLSLSSENKGDQIHMDDINDEKIGPDSIISKGFYPEAAKTRVVMRRDHRGRVFLVSTESPNDTSTPGIKDKDIYIAQKEKAVTAN